MGVGTITEKTIKDYIENQENKSEGNFKIVSKQAMYFSATEYKFIGINH